MEIEQRLSTENDMFVVEVLRWVLDGGCVMCDFKKCKEYEIEIMNQETSPDYLEAKHTWPEGTVIRHMESHVEFDPDEAAHVEAAREQTINTLDSAEDIVIRIRTYLDELEERKEQHGGITSEFVTDASRLIAQANSSLKLVGQLKKEIGVDSQLLLAQAQMNNMSNILVDVLRHDPHLLDQIELHMAALKAPKVIDTEFEVIE
jgi:tRNA U55 pseudouridine synthase TruB